MSPPDECSTSIVPLLTITADSDKFDTSKIVDASVVSPTFLSSTIAENKIEIQSSASLSATIDIPEVDSKFLRHL